MSVHSFFCLDRSVRHWCAAHRLTDRQRELLEQMASGGELDHAKVGASLYCEMQRRGLIRDSKTITRFGMEAIGRARDAIVDVDAPLPAIN